MPKSFTVEAHPTSSSSYQQLAKSSIGGAQGGQVSYREIMANGNNDNGGEIGESLMSKLEKTIQ